MFLYFIVIFLNVVVLKGKHLRMKGNDSYSLGRDYKPFSNIVLSLPRLTKVKCFLVDGNW